MDNASDILPYSSQQTVYKYVTPLHVCDDSLNITVTILYIIHRPIFYLEDNVWETGFFLRNVLFSIKGRTMDNVQNCDSYVI
jgi:hypothetical protein